MTANEWIGECPDPGFPDYRDRHPDVNWDLNCYWSVTNNATGEVINEGHMLKSVADEYFPMIAEELRKADEGNAGRVHGGREPGRLRRWLAR